MIIYGYLTVGRSEFLSIMHFRSTYMLKYMRISQIHVQESKVLEEPSAFYFSLLVRNSGP